MKSQERSLNFEFIGYGALPCELKELNFDQLFA